MGRRDGVELESGLTYQWVCSEIMPPADQSHCIGLMDGFIFANKGGKMLCFDDNVSQYMHPDPVVVGLSDDLLLIQDLFTNRRCSHIVVVEDRIPVGIISLNDLLFCNLDKVYSWPKGNENSSGRNSFLAADIMSRNVITLNVKETVRKALEIFSMKAFHALPVVNEAGEVCGLLTLENLLLPMQKNQ